ncbi:hypothetical protein ACFLT5_02430 [Chloroflexota bacterium]
MAKATNLTEGREELKQRLADGEYRSSVDVILDTVGRILQKLTRRPRPPAFWISALAIALLVSLVAFLASLLTDALSRDAYLTIILGGTLIFLNLVIARSTFRRTFDTLQKKLLDGLESNAGLTGLHAWLRGAADIKWPVLLGLFTYVLYVAFILPDPIAAPSPIETIIVGGFMLWWTGFLIYYMFLFVLLPLRLGRCQFKLHTEDPVSTEVLLDWSKMMSFAAYMFAFMLATGTLFTATAATFRLRTLIFIIPRWLPLITLFVVNQMAMSGVITRSKRKSLNEVEAQMAALRPTGDPPEHENMQTLLWLWDYHDRIIGSRGSFLHLRGILNLVNTLLIPLLAFLVANRQALFELVGWSPWT